MPELIEVTFNGPDAAAAHMAVMALAGLSAVAVAPRPDNKMEVSIFVNGVEGSFRQVVKRYNESWDEAVRDEAKRLLNEKCVGLASKLSSLEAEVDALIANHFGAKP